LKDCKSPVRGEERRSPVRREGRIGSLFHPSPSGRGEGEGDFRELTRKSGMGTYFFHEDTSSNTGDGGLSIVRYYYDDISEDILIRSFRLPPTAVRKEFLGNHMIPRADLQADVKAKLKDFLYRRMQAERRPVS
jgi:hypothetical protein